MNVEQTQRGFDLITMDGTPGRLVQTSSAIGDYEDALDKPGSSFLWLGEEHHLDREEVAQLVTHLQKWLETGRL